MTLLALLSCTDAAPTDDSAPVPVDGCVPFEAGYANVEPILESECGSCHGVEPDFGAPYSLVDGYADLVAGTVGERKVDAVLAELLAGTMPQGGDLSHTDLDTLIGWSSCGVEHAPESSDLIVNREVWDAPDSPPEGAEALDLLVSDQSVGVNDIDDYRTFEFENLVDDSVYIRRIEPVIDESRVLHHITLTRGPGYPYLYAWAPGTNAIEFPDGGMVLGPGDKLNLEVHYNNGAGIEDAVDNSGLRLWISDEADVVYGMMSPQTWDMYIPAGETREFTAKCTATADFQIYAGMPHMHEVGSTFVHEVERADGTVENLVELSGWSFEQQHFYAMPMTINAGDKMRMTCGYDNTTDTAVQAGLGTSDEMCFDFLVVTPASASL